VLATLPRGELVLVHTGQEALEINLSTLPDCHGKSSIQEEEDSFTSKLDVTLRRKLVKCYICSIAWHGAECWTLRKVDQK
jgi:hypothetical protein